MSLEELVVRKAQLDQALENSTQSVFILRGHVAEVNFQISEFQKKQAEEANDAATLDGIPVENQAAAQ